MTHTVHHVRRSLISIDARLANIPMMGDVAKKFLESPKLELKKLGRDMAAEIVAFNSSLDEHGIIEPIKAYRKGRRWITADGRHRIDWVDAAAHAAEQASNRKQDPRIPLIEISEEEAEALIEASVIGRRHWTMGQRAWLGVMQHPEVCDAPEGRPKNSDSVGVNRSDSVGATVNNATALATRLGVSADTVSQAVKLYRLFFAPGAKASSPEAIEAAALRAKYEHLIWGGSGLGGVLAGIAGGESTAGKPKAPTGFHHLDAPLASLSRLGKVFITWTAEEQAKAQTLIIARIRGGEGQEGWPPEFRQALAEALVNAE